MAFPGLAELVSHSPGQHLQTYYQNTFMTKPLLRGMLKTWKEDRGFGFITPDNGGRDVFIHITALKGQDSRRPEPGDIIHYQLVRDKNGKFRAINANIENTRSGIKMPITNKKSKPGVVWISAIAVCLIIIIAGALYFYYKSQTS